MSYVTLSMNPMQSNGTVRREIERLLQDVMPTGTPAFAPAVNGFEDEQGFRMEFDVPGFTPDQLDITAQEGTLVVRGTRATPELKGVRPLFIERPAGSFERRIRLPKTADIGNVAASYAHGVLTVRVEKLATVAPRKVAINIAEPVSTPQVSAESDAK